MVFKRRIINVFIKLFANKKWLKSSISTINFIGRDDTRKLFFYDLAALSTVSKTIVLVILGIILLIVSFLYNKYKEIIFGDDTDDLTKNPII